MSKSEKVSRIIDPGAGGWPTPPKVSLAEVALYGPLAEAIRLLGTAATAAGDAYALTCRAAQDAFGVSGDAEAFAKPLVQVTYQLQVNAHQTLREVAEAAIAKQREWEQFAHGTQTVGDGPNSATDEQLEQAVADREITAKTADMTREAR